jgi:hypothetical protein
MIINKLRTSIQFENYLTSLSDEKFCELENKRIAHFTPLEIDGLRYQCLQRYNKWIESRYERGMFINDFLEPDSINYGTDTKESIRFNNDYQIWKKHESKVIFKTHLTQSYLKSLNVHTIAQLAEKADIELNNVKI